MTTTTLEKGPMPSSVEAMMLAVDELNHEDEPKQFDYNEAVKKLEDAGVGNFDATGFGMELQEIADLVNSGSDDSLTTAKEYYERHLGNLDAAVENNEITAEAKSAIENMLTEAIGREGVAKLTGAEATKFDFDTTWDKLREGGVSQEAATVITAAFGGIESDLKAGDIESAKKRLEFLDKDVDKLIEDGKLPDGFEDFVDSLLVDSFSEEALVSIGMEFEDDEESAEDAQAKIDATIAELKNTEHFADNGAEEIAELVSKLADMKEGDDGEDELATELKAKISEMTDDDELENKMFLQSWDVVVKIRRDRRPVMPVAGGEPAVPVAVDDLQNALDNAVAAEADDNNPNTRKSIRQRLKDRWTRIQVGFGNISNGGITEMGRAVFGNENGEKAKRNGLIAAGVGATALALVVYLANKGVDMPWSGADGNNVNPFGKKVGAVEYSPGGGGGGSAVGEAFGIDVSTDMPWTVANKVSPGGENSLITKAMEEYSRQAGVEVAFTGRGTNTMIQVGDHIANPADLKRINELIVNSAA